MRGRVTPGGHDLEPRPKLAEQVARQVESDIVAMGWPVGRALGTESSLAEAHGVSRAVMREAARLLEHHMAVSAHRGRGGGLTVAQPEIEAVLPVVALYLDCEGVSPATLFEARAAIELSAVELAAERITGEGRRQLRAAVAAEKRELEDPHRYLVSHELHVLLAGLSGNPALRLFVAVLTRLSSDHVSAKSGAVARRRALQIGRDISRAHDRIVEAVLHGDAPLARQRMLTHLRAITPWLT